MNSLHVINSKNKCTVLTRLRSSLFYIVGCGVLFAFVHCEDYPLSSKSSNDQVVTKVTSQRDKDLLGNAVLRVSYEAETTSWGEVVNQDNARPGSEQIIKNIGLTMVDRTSNVFKLFEDGSYEMTIIRQKPRSDIPNVMYSTPKDPAYENAHKTVVTNELITAFDQAGNVLFTLPYKGTKMLALVKAIGKECDVSKAFVNNLPLLTLNGNASAILSNCARSAVRQEGGDIISTKDGLIIVKRKMANMDLEARPMPAMWGVVVGPNDPLPPITPHDPTPPDDPAPTPPLPDPSPIVPPSGPVPIPPLPNLKGNVPDEAERDQIQLRDMTIMGNLQAQYSALAIESMTIVDSTNNKVLGVAIISSSNENEMSLISTSRYKYNNDLDQQIRMVHHELYQTDLASGLNVQRNMQVEYANVKVLARD